MARPICKTCGAYPADSKGLSKSGVRMYRNICTSCKSKPWVKFKKDCCEICGFIPIHRVQLDVDHIDGDKGNCSEDNLQTLCANCHRLKTYLNEDWKSKEQMELESLQLTLI